MKIVSKKKLEENEPSENEQKKLLSLYQCGKLDDANELALLFTQKYSQHALGWKVLGALLGQAGQYIAALEANRKAVEISPSDAKAHNNLGSTFMKTGKLDDAVSSFKKAIAIDPNLAEAHYNLANVFKSQNNLPEAEISYKRSTSLKPNYDRAYNNLGVTLHELGKLRDAEEALEEAIKLRPDFADAYYNLGNTQKELKKLLNAEKCYKKAIHFEFDDVKVHHNLGVVLQEMGKLNEAELAYKEALKCKSDFADSLLNLSILYSYLDAYELEISTLESLLKIDSDHFGLRASVNLAICKFLDGSFEKSKRLLVSATGIQRKVSSIFDNEKVYQKYLLRLLKWHDGNNQVLKKSHKYQTFFTLGESHSLVSHQLNIRLFEIDFLFQAKLIKGCMQWHLGSSSLNKYKNKFKSVFLSIPNSSYLLLSVGEIDCRIQSGIFKHIKKHPEKSVRDVINITIVNYLKYIIELNRNKKHIIFIQGVPCPNIDVNNYSKGTIDQLIEIIKLFNFELEKQLITKGFRFLDVHKITDRGDGLSNQRWHIDKIHLSPAGFIEAWKNFSAKSP